MKRAMDTAEEIPIEVDAIEHDGVVVGSGSGVVEVRLVDDGNCGTCPAARLCSVAGKSAQVVRINTPHYADFTVGERVLVDGSEKLHRKAIRLVTIYPTLGVLAVMVALYLLFGSQMIAAVGGLLVLLLAGVGIYARRERLNAVFVFTIRKIET